MQNGANTSEVRKRGVIRPRVLEILVGAFLNVLILCWKWPVLTYTSDSHRLRILRAKAEMMSIENAMLRYETEYGKMPTRPETSRKPKGDFTFGTVATGCGILVQNPGDGRQANNSEMTAILMVLTTFRNGQATVNTNHGLNPKRIEFLNAKSSKGSQLPGVGEDGVYRDPWGNPYLITLDVSGDGFSVDPLYGRVRQKVFVWSFGPDRKADLNVKPHEGVNADNVTPAP